MGPMRRPSSVPVLPGYVRAGTPPPEEDIGRQNRRWTMPSKSAPTRGFTPLRSTVKQATLSDGIESPAMITLRRATTNKAPKRIELTFFPEPKFGNERNGLLSYLVSTFTRASATDITVPFFADGKGSRTSSVASGGAHPTVTYPAATVCTETTVESSLVKPGMFLDKQSPRRCSAKYVSGVTSYEVIWDENDSFTTTQGSSRPSVSDRRSSQAVVKLESQLAQSNAGSRRTSDQSASSSSRASPDSAEQKYAQALTPDKLEQIFPRLLHKTELQDLPKSRSGRRQSDTVCSITVDEPEHQTLVDNRSQKASTFTIDFFPSLSGTSSRRASDARSPLCFGGPGSPRRQQGSHNGEAGSPESDSSPTKRISSLGNMIGASSHVRRRSSVFTDNSWRRESVAKRLVRSSSKHICEEGERDRDTAPLLGQQMKGRSSHKS